MCSGGLGSRRSGDRRTSNEVRDIPDSFLFDDDPGVTRLGIAFCRRSIYCWVDQS